MMDFSRLRANFLASLWHQDLAKLPRWRVWVVKLLRFAFVVARDLASGQLTLRAMSLVYTTLLSLVPLLAVSFSVLQAFGVHNRIEPVLRDQLAPLGESGAEITAWLIGFVENMNVRVLGSVGFALLFYTVISLVHKIERSFNYIWRIDRDRTFAERFSNYLSVILVGPVLVFAASGLTATLMDTSAMQTVISVEPLGQLVSLAGRLVPYLFLAGAFTFFYVFLPNTKVNFAAGLLGGIVAATLWQFNEWIIATFVITSTNYALIYSAFATLVFFLIALYLSWVIVLIGTSVAFYHQHPEHITLNPEKPSLSNRLKEKLALLLMSRIVTGFYAKQPPLNEQTLAQQLGVPVSALESVLVVLTSRGLLARTADIPPTYLPAQPLDTTSVHDVITAIRSAEEQDTLPGQHLDDNPVIERLLERLDAALGQTFRQCTLKDLVVEPVAKCAELGGEAERQAKHQEP